MTNREWLLKEMQNMSDEEMAEKIIEKFCVCNSQESLGKCSEYKACIDCYLNWLKAEYKKEIKLTEAERAILESLDKDYKWIARDKSEQLFIYENKPYKDIDYYSWEDVSGKIEKISIFNHIFRFIAWEDEEPYNIEELLKGD